MNKDREEEERRDILKNFGRRGLIERLNNWEIELGKNNPKIILEALSSHKDEICPYLGDDFLPNTDVYNLIGAFYPIWSKEQRTDMLKFILRKMDGIRYDKVSHNHTPYIRDPQLLSDISASRPNYWPGLHDEKALWQGRSFHQIKKEIIDDNGLFKLNKVESDFLVAYALLRSDFTNFGEQYLQIINPNFLKRVLKGIVALRFAGIGENQEEITQRRDRLRRLLPKSLHEQIDLIREEKDWIFIKETIV